MTAPIGVNPVVLRALTYTAGGFGGYHFAEALIRIAEDREHDWHNRGAGWKVSPKKIVDLEVVAIGNRAAAGASSHWAVPGSPQVRMDAAASAVPSAESEPVPGHAVSGNASWGLEGYSQGAQGAWEEHQRAGSEVDGRAVPNTGHVVAAVPGRPVGAANHWGEGGRYPEGASKPSPAIILRVKDGDNVSERFLGLRLEGKLRFAEIREDFRISELEGGGWQVEQQMPDAAEPNRILRTIRRYPKMVKGICAVGGAALVWSGIRKSLAPNR